MLSGDDKKTQDNEAVEREDSLADQALEAIVRSQQLRARSRNLRKKQDADAKAHRDEDRS